MYFFHGHRGKPIGEKFCKDMKGPAQASGVPLIRFAAGERKADVMAPDPQAAAPGALADDRGRLRAPDI